MHTHIIYYTTYLNKIVYIGSGTAKRYSHTTSGTSHIYELNRLHFEEPGSISTYILKGFTSQKEALKEESALIEKFKPKFNTLGLEHTDVRYSFNKEEIEEHQDSFIPIVKEELSLADRIKYDYKVSFKDLCLLYESGEEALVEQADPLIIEYYKVLGKDKIKAYTYNSTRIRQLYDIEFQSNYGDNWITKFFKVGEVYSRTYISEQLKKHNAAKTSASYLSKFFLLQNTKDTSKKHAFKIIKKL